MGRREAVSLLSYALLRPQSPLPFQPQKQNEKQVLSSVFCLEGERRRGKRSENKKMGKKKPFVDKKNCSTFHLLHRSQRDVSQHLLHADEEGYTGDATTAAFIWWPAEGNNPATNQVVLGGGGGGQSGTSGNDDDGDVARRNQDNEDCMQRWRAKLKQVGLLDEGHESPDRYLKEITGTGTFLSANGKIGEQVPTNVVLLDHPQQQQRRVAADDNVDVDMLEVKDQVDNIPLKDALDDDIAAILYGDSDAIDFDQFEELNDEFVLDAAKEIEEVQPQSETEAPTAFDYDAHIQKLMEKARQERQLQGLVDPSSLNHHEWARRDQDFFTKLNVLSEQRDEDDGDGDGDNDDDDDSFANLDDALLYPTTGAGAVARLSPDEESALREKFEQTLLEYDSDEIGDNPDEEIVGRLPLEGDDQVESALNDYLQEKNDEIFMQGRPRRAQQQGGGHGGSGFSALVGTRMVTAKELAEFNDENHDVTELEPLEQVLAQARARLAEPPLQPPPEEIIMDGQSYFSERIRNPWDCESILSTYSNLDNNPVTISHSTSSRRRKGRSKGQKGVNGSSSAGDEEQTTPQIQLSNKTGLPLPSNFASTEIHNKGNTSVVEEMMTIVSVNKGQARQKEESTEEKKIRKAIIKRERQIARIQKKVTREVYEQEFAKHSVAVHGVGGSGDPIAGRPVFRYS